VVSSSLLPIAQVYREVRQSLIDMDMMMALTNVKSEIQVRF
jgi:ABC-type transport system involved in Fe-S cluster assembly fused permease/ATPase subunit